MLRLFFFCLFVPLMLAIPAGMKLLTQGFHLGKMALQFPFHPEWEIGMVPLEVREILGQPYRYLDRGAQCYVFAAEDGKHVIKLFRYDQRENFFSFKRRKLKTVPSVKILHLFNACKLAYDRAQSETGLIYIHLNPTALDLPVLHCKDALARSYHIPLDQYRFAVQKKAEPFRKTLEKERFDLRAIEKRIDAFFNLLQTRTAAQILNSDANLSRNFGFYEERAIEIDFGNYRDSKELLSRENRLREIHRFAHRFGKWLKRHIPEALPYFQARMKSLEENE